ncbi:MULTISPECIES: tautomerase family protein [unclassified Crossiella]|uniref:tautomerase family protein n=1 Tax=unclassified Crossiella TaxID=2620835 RepID=UPI001FFF1F01|nr:MULTISPECIES: tautomerase family protein [unclassified Crossiella]MCK2239022.1 4-oxalocrotonate tautomerase family protein [Crossiella sp. S99.2]MCK2251409.1 4-oxalocrotonate tautomerase family protein [Crossiella sp. S99.1]
MPIVRIDLAEGRDPDTLRACLHAVHAAIRDSLGVRDEQIRVLLNEIPPRLWSAGGQTLAEKTTHTEREQER